MENENNPWLEITKQPISNNPQKPGLNGTIWKDLKVIGHQLLMDELLYGRSLLQIEPTIQRLDPRSNILLTPKDCYDPDDLKEALDIIEAFMDDNHEEFNDYLFNEYGIPDCEADYVYYFLDSKVKSTVELVDFLYENHIWD